MTRPRVECIAVLPVPKKHSCTVPRCSKRYVRGSTKSRKGESITDESTQTRSLPNGKTVIGHDDAMQVRSWTSDQHGQGLPRRSTVCKCLPKLMGWPFADTPLGRALEPWYAERALLLLHGLSGFAFSTGPPPNALSRLPLPAVRQVLQIAAVMSFFVARFIRIDNESSKLLLLSPETWSVDPPSFPPQFQEQRNPVPAWLLPASQRLCSQGQQNLTNSATASSATEDWIPAYSHALSDFSEEHLSVLLICSSHFLLPSPLASWSNALTKQNCVITTYDRSWQTATHMHRVYPAAGQAPLGPHKSFYNVVVDLDKRDAIKFGGTSFILGSSKPESVGYLWKPRKRITDLFHCRSWAKHPHV